VNPAAPT